MAIKLYKKIATASIFIYSSFLGIFKITEIDLLVSGQNQTSYLFFPSPLQFFNFEKLLAVGFFNLFGLLGFVVFWCIVVWFLLLGLF